jgi:hypothetical protein
MDRGWMDGGRYGINGRQFVRSKARWENTMITTVCVIEAAIFMSTIHVAINSNL